MEIFICTSEVSRFYKVIYSLNHPPSPPPRKRVKLNKRNTEQPFEGPNYSYFCLFSGKNSIIFRKDSEWRYFICINEISRI